MVENPFQSPTFCHWLSIAVYVFVPAALAIQAWATVGEYRALLARRRNREP
jgi:hypothetical protein